MMKKTHIQNSGFTIVETMVALSLLIVAITGAYSAAQTGLSSAIYARDQVTAFYLAQEGVEQIRNMRDENALKGRSWLAGIASLSTDPCYFGNFCKVDTINNTVLPCSGTHNSCPVVAEDPVNGYYGYDGSWVPTPFTRSVTLTSLGNDEISVLVTVTWSKGSSAPITFSIHENMMNWQ